MKEYIICLLVLIEIAKENINIISPISNTKNGEQRFDGTCANEWNVTKKH